MVFAQAERDQSLDGGLGYDTLNLSSIQNAHNNVDAAEF
jgi:hypothetical protein